MQIPLLTPNESILKVKQPDAVEPLTDKSSSVEIDSFNLHLARITSGDKLPENNANNSDISNSLDANVASEVQQEDNSQRAPERVKDPEVKEMSLSTEDNLRQSNGEEIADLRLQLMPSYVSDIPVAGAGDAPDSAHQENYVAQIMLTENNANSPEHVIENKIPYLNLVANDSKVSDIALTDTQPLPASVTATDNVHDNQTDTLVDTASLGRMAPDALSGYSKESSIEGKQPKQNNPQLVEQPAKDTVQRIVKPNKTVIKEADQRTSRPTVRVDLPTQYNSSVTKEAEGLPQPVDPHKASAQRVAVDRLAGSSQTGRIVQFLNNNNQSASDESTNGNSSNFSSQQFLEQPESTAQRNVAPASARAVQINAAVEIANTTQSLSGETVSSPATFIAPSMASNAASAPSISATGNENSVFSQQNEPAALTSKVVRGMSAMVNHRGGTMTMRLDPPELGRLQIQMKITNGSVVARFLAENAQAQTMIEQNLHILKTSLEQQGMTVERLVVQTAQNNQQTDMNSKFDSNDSDSNENQSDAGNGESKGKQNGESSESGYEQTSQRSFVETKGWAEELNRKLQKEEHMSERMAV